MARVVATISGHGFGHLSISAPVLNRLGVVIPDLKLTIVSGLTEERIQSRVRFPFSYRQSNLDFGVSMMPDLSVRIEDTTKRYRQLHDRWQSSVRDYADWLDTMNCDVLLSNVSYLSLAAAQRLGIPSLALCSLNWADICRYFLSRTQEFECVHDQMVQAYASARIFLAPDPSMPMDPRLPVRRIGPVAETGRNRKKEIQTRLGTDPSCRLILVAMGGHDLQFSVRWPEQGDLVWLVPRSWGIEHARTVSIESLDIPFLDLLASTDLLITKPGYGSFTEAACVGKPVLYVLRPDWPEERYLVDWLHQNCCCERLDPGRLQSGEFVNDVLALLDGQPVTGPPNPTGTEEAIGAIRQLLGL